MINMIADIHYNGFNWPFVRVVNLFLVVVVLMIVYKHHIALKRDIRKFNYSKSGVYGTAQLLDAKDASDVAEIEKVEEADGLILGRLDPKSAEHLVVYKQNAGKNHNIMVFGPPGTGKTVGLVMNAILQYVKFRHSMVITDIKGELKQKTAMYLREQGYKVLSYDLESMNESDSWNILSTVTGDLSEKIERVDKIVSIIVQNSNIKVSTFVDGATSLLTAAILRVVLGDDFPEGKKNLASVYDLLMDIPNLKTNFDPMTHPEAEIACTIYRDVSSSSENAFLNMRGTVTNAIGIFKTPSVRAVTSYDNITITELGDEPTVIFVRPHKTYVFLSSLFFSFLFEDLQNKAKHNERPGIQENSLTVPVHFILDEFAQIGFIPDLSETLSQIRSYGISCMLILQSYNQLESVYGLISTTILADCSVWLVLGSNDPETSKILSERAGVTTAAVKTVQHRAWETIFTFVHRSSTGDGKRDIYTLDEIYRIKDNQALIYFQQKNVFPVFKFPYFEHPVAKAGKLVWLTKEYTPPPLTVTGSSGKPVYNKEERDAYYLKMEQDIQRYKDTHPNGEETAEKVSKAKGIINNIKSAYEDAQKGSTKKKRRKRRKKTKKSTAKTILSSEAAKSSVDQIEGIEEQVETAHVTVIENISSAQAYMDIFSAFEPDEDYAEVTDDPDGELPAPPEPESPITEMNAETCTAAQEREAEPEPEPVTRSQDPQWNPQRGQGTTHAGEKSTVEVPIRDLPETIPANPGTKDNNAPQESMPDKPTIKLPGYIYEPKKAEHDTEKVNTDGNPSGSRFKRAAGNRNSSGEENIRKQAGGNYTNVKKADNGLDDPLIL